MAIDTKPIEYLVRELGATLTWYQRKRTADYPMPYLNVFQDIDESTAEYEKGANTKVADQPSLWVDKGKIKAIVASGYRKKNIAIKEEDKGQEMIGGYEAVISDRYDVKEDDRLVDSNSQEFKVLSYAQEENFKILDLKLL